MLGDDVHQAGSAVRPDKLRFDFTHGQALTSEERAEIERRVNEQIFGNVRVGTFETPIDEARKLGAMMLFGEKYGDVVRVVEVDGYSRELCGGTHVRSTAEIGAFAILSEGSVGSGARRIEAVTSGEAFAFLHGRAAEADALRTEIESLKKEARKPQAAASADVVWEDQTDGVFIAEVKGARGPALRDLSDQLRQQKNVLAVLLGSVDDGKVSLVVNFDRSLPERGLDAVAEAGGKQPDGLRGALEAGQKTVVAGLA